MKTSDTARGTVTATGKSSSSSRLGLWRMTILSGAFVLIAINPLLNYYLHLSFIQGWYQSFGLGDLWFVSPLEGLESFLITKTLYLPSLIGMLIPVLIAVLLGRVFCSWLCPITFILEGFDRLRKALSRKRFLANRLIVAKKVLWFTLITEIVVSMVLGAPLFVFLSPPGLVGREIMMAVFFRTLALEGVIIVLIVLLELLTRRMYCRSFCPLGAALALLGTRRRLTVHLIRDKCTTCRICEKVCPMGLLPYEAEGTSAYCWNCGECVSFCRFDALQFNWGPGCYPSLSRDNISY